MTTSEITNPARGPWTAFAVEGSGEILVDHPLTAEYLESIVVVRGSAMPIERDGVLQLPETGRRDDVLYEIEDLGDDPDNAAIVWEQAQAVAAALNAAAGGAWSVPKIPYDENALVGPRIIGEWIFRSNGQSDAEHARHYAAQLLAAADVLDLRTADAEAGRQCPACTSPYRDRRFVMPAPDGTAPCGDEWHNLRAVNSRG